MGILYYGDTVEVGVDVGNYNDHRELEQSVQVANAPANPFVRLSPLPHSPQEMHFVGGNPDPVLAIRSAQQLLSELEPNLIKVVLHVHRHKLSQEAANQLEHIARTDSIALLDLTYERWGVLENLEPYWRLLGKPPNIYP